MIIKYTKFMTPNFDCDELLGMLHYFY